MFAGPRWRRLQWLTLEATFSISFFFFLSNSCSDQRGKGGQSHGRCLPSVLAAAGQRASTCQAFHAVCLGLGLWQACVRLRNAGLEGARLQLCTRSLPNRHGTCGTDPCSLALP